MSSRRFTRMRPTPRANDVDSCRTLIQLRLGRRSLMQAAAAALVSARIGRAHAAGPSSLTFPELRRVKDQHDHWPSGYRRQVLIRWGDPVLPEAPSWRATAQSGAAQAEQFGINNDFTAYLPLPPGSGSSSHGLLVVSHEYASPWLMWPGLEVDGYREALTPEQVAVVKSAVGLSVLEVRAAADGWQVVPGRYSRRITLDTPIRIAGPCAGDPRMRTAADPSGTLALGTMPNCGGGITPWGTVLSGEEGAMDYFGGDYRALPDQEVVARQGWDEEDNDGYGLAALDPRFDLGREPNEWNRFDWVVEIDPFDPAAMPVKRTALGRFTHEGAQCVTAADGRLVVLMGDDDDFEYLYRFITARRVDLADRVANRDLLDDGVLSVARLDGDGGLVWLPLVHGQGPLTATNGFADQADVLFKTRLAADALGATPMDSAEGFVPNLVTGRIYVAMTENEDRLPVGEGDAREQVDAANPRAPNPHGHILELVPPRDADGVDWAAERYGWEVMVLCGDPTVPDEQARFHPATSRDGWFTDPDNLAHDPAGRLWVCTDGPPPAGIADAVYAMDCDGPGRALPKLFYIPPVGSEACSPAFTPDGRTLFLSVQHPGEVRMDGEDARSVATMDTAWPEFVAGVPARPSVVVLMREDGGEVGA